MTYRKLFFAFVLMFTPNLVFGACSVANLTRCLDSACAINIGANPAARCQYCGTNAAGEPTKSAAMRSVSAGTNSRYSISDKELKKAPADAGERYVWATELCLQKVSGCTTDDVTDNYDTLIEQSCKAAGISAEMDNLVKKANTTKTQTSCTTEISACVVDVKRCTAGYKNCESDTDFDKYFSECSIAATGCDSFLKSIRSNLIASRNTAFKNAKTLLQNIVATYQSMREQKLTTTRKDCADNSAKERCIANVCSNNMRYKCGLDASVLCTGNEKYNCKRLEDINYETSVAEQLCKFYDIACERLK